MKWSHLALAVIAMSVVVTDASAQRKRTATARTPSGPERSLLGINLFAQNVAVLKKFGSPDEIQPVVIGGMGAPGGGMGAPGGMGGPGGRMGGPGMGGPGMGGPGMGGPGGRGSSPGGQPIDSNRDWNFGDSILGEAANMRQMSGPGLPPGAGGPPAGFGGPPAGFGGPPGGMGGPPGMGGPGGRMGGPGMGGPGGPGAPGGAPRAGGGAADNVNFTRWIYNRDGSKYAFVIDRMGRVVQVETIGLKNPKVRTNRGITFGSDFQTIIFRYGNPDSYDINGDNITMRYLSRAKVAFKLSRLGPNKKHQVTGVIVAAGK